jgi:hypothetical protein
MDAKQIKKLKQKFISELKQCQVEHGDVESDHATADLILVELLNTLGFEDVTAEWEKVEKWYA